MAPHLQRFGCHKCNTILPLGRLCLKHTARYLITLDEDDNTEHSQSSNPKISSVKKSRKKYRSRKEIDSSSSAEDEPSQEQETSSSDEAFRKRRQTKSKTKSTKVRSKRRKSSKKALPSVDHSSSLEDEAFEKPRKSKVGDKTLKGKSQKGQTKKKGKSLRKDSLTSSTDTESSDDSNSDHEVELPKSNFQSQSKQQKKLKNDTGTGKESADVAKMAVTDSKRLPTAEDNSLVVGAPPPRLFQYDAEASSIIALVDRSQFPTIGEAAKIVGRKPPAYQRCDKDHKKCWPEDFEKYDSRYEGAARIKQFPGTKCMDCGMSHPTNAHERFWEAYTRKMDRDPHDPDNTTKCQICLKQNRKKAAENHFTRDHGLMAPYDLPINPDIGTLGDPHLLQFRRPWPEARGLVPFHPYAFHPSKLKAHKPAGYPNLHKPFIPLRSGLMVDDGNIVGQINAIQLGMQYRSKGSRKASIQPADLKKSESSGRTAPKMGQKSRLKEDATEHQLEAKEPDSRIQPELDRMTLIDSRSPIEASTSPKTVHLFEDGKVHDILSQSRAVKLLETQVRLAQQSEEVIRQLGQELQSSAVYAQNHADHAKRAAEEARKAASDAENVSKRAQRLAEQANMESERIQTDTEDASKRVSRLVEDLRAAKEAALAAAWSSQEQRKDAEIVRQQSNEAPSDAMLPPGPQSVSRDLVLRLASSGKSWWAR